MSVKRTATTDLNHENWDQEDPSASEEMGTFKTASKDVLENRIIKTAKRRSQVSGEEPKRSAFSGFGGFNKAQPASFDFLANLTNGSKNTNGTKSDTAVTSSLFSSRPATSPSSGLFGIPPAGTATSAFSGLQTSPFTSTPKQEIPTMTFSSSKADSTVGDSPFKIQSVSSSADSNAKLSTAPQVSSTIFGVSSTSPNQKLLTNSAEKQPVSSTSTAVQNSAAIDAQSNSNKSEAAFDRDVDIENARHKYYSKLKGLNESVSRWIVKHVEKTSLCFLTPIFKDYDNYLKEIQEEYEAAKKEIDVKSKQETEVKPAFGFKDGGASLFPNKSVTPQDATKTAQTSEHDTTPAVLNTNTMTNPGFFSTPPVNKSDSSPNKIPTFAKGFSFGVAPTTATNTIPSNTANTKNSGTTPNQGFSFGIQPMSSSTNAISAFASTNTNLTSPPKGFSFGITSPPAPTSPTNLPLFTGGANTATPVKGFSFGMSTTSPISPPNPLANIATSAAPFSFGIGAGKPFSFNSTQQNIETEKKNEDEEDQPPKVEFTPVVEENSVFDKKCKIFVKKDGNFVDKGVGTLYIKKIAESGKHQLLVRANTNLGTVLLNLILSSAVPAQRTGKNNVMLVCIPTPDAKPPPTPVLIRVKTGEEADGLLELLNKYKS